MTPNVNVRRLAAVDMYGARGTLRRRRVILAEFVLGVVGGAGFGAWVLFDWSGPARWLIGGYLLGLALNYGALALHAITLARPGSLDEELRDVNMPAAFRHYNTAQFWIFVPMLFAVLAVADPQVRAGR